MKSTRTAALILAGVVTLSAAGAQTATAKAGRSFIAKRGTVSIAFKPGVVATFRRLGIEFATSGTPVPARAAYPALQIVPAASEGPRAPKTPLSTAKPAGIVYIGSPAAVGFYQQLPTSNTQGGIDYPEVTLGAHPALAGVLHYSHTGSNDVIGTKLSSFFLLNTRHIKPVLKGRTLTLKKIPMTFAPAAFRFFKLFGSGFTAHEALGTLTIKAVR